MTRQYLAALGRAFAPSVVSAAMLAAGLCSGCATTTTANDVVQQDIESARTAYERAESGPASEVAPDELLDARSALEEAERAYQVAPDAASSRDLAYLAERRAELVEARVGIALARWRIDMVRKLRTQLATEGK